MKPAKQLPPDRISGFVVEMICFAEYNLYINLFKDEKSIITSSIDCVFTKDNISSSESDRIKYIISLAGDEVLSNRIESDGSLHISFISGKELSIKDKYKNFESYSVKIGEENFIN